MAAYDRLPPRVRAALRVAIDDIAPQPLVTALNRGHDQDDVLSMIERFNSDERAKRAYQRARAIGVYKGLAPDPSVKAHKRRRAR
jgi:hypothetical protein